MENTAAKGLEEKQKDRYLTFVAADELYGIPIEDVTEIVGVLPATRLPGAPAYVKGLMNLRGRIVPVVDMRERLLKPFAAYDDKACTVIVTSGGLTAGLIADRVSDVVTVEDEIIPYPNKGALDYIGGMVRMNGQAIYLLDCAALLER